MRLLRRLAPASITTALAALLLASAASASSHNPTGEFSPFGECPLSRPNLTDCVFLVTNDGSLKIGTKTIPLQTPITLQGGYGGGAPIEFFGAENGATLSKTPQPVPGGLPGTAPGTWPKAVQDWYNHHTGTGFTGFTATIELAAPATSIGLSTENLLFEEGTALSLPVKIKFDSTILGSSCYIGSNTEPIQIDLTTGTSGSLKGTPGELTFNKEFTLITFKDFKLVNETFEVPEAEGCGGAYSAYVDPLVNAIFMPSGPENSLVLEGNLKDAWAEAVRASDM